MLIGQLPLKKVSTLWLKLSKNVSTDLVLFITGKDGHNWQKCLPELLKSVHLWDLGAKLRT